jgi:hypothetical protein
LIGLGLDLLRQAGARRPVAFRAGSFAADENTFHTLSANGLRCDSSLNSIMADSAPELRSRLDLDHTQKIHDIASCPVSAFRDGLGRVRHAQVGACSSSELVGAMHDALARAGGSS